MGQGQDPYGDAGGFTPYQPDATPDGEPTSGPAPVPFVPYGGEPVVPYGGAALPQFYATTTTTSAGRRVLPWVVALGVLVASCGGGVAAIVGIVASIDDSDSGEAGVREDVFVNDLQADQCLNGAGFATGEPVSALAIVDCSLPHDVQVLNVNPLDSKEAAEYDFDDPGSSGRACNPVLSRQQKELLQGQEYGLVAFTETGSPGVGDLVACLVKRTDGEPIDEFLPAVSPEPTA